MRNKLILAMIAFFCSLLVSGFNYLLYDRIEATKKQKDLSVKKSFFPEAKIFEENEIGLIIAKKDDNTELGYIYYTEDPSGYSGKVKFAVSLNLDGTLKDFLMVEHAETPGLGTKVNEDWFKNSFKSLFPLKENLPSGKKDFKEKLGIDVISGATITSMATVRAISKDSQKYVQWILERKMKKLEETYKQYDKSTSQNMNVIIKKKPQPIQQNQAPILPIKEPVKTFPQSVPQKKQEIKPSPQKPQFKPGESPI